MGLFWIVCGLVPLLVGLSSASPPPDSYVDPYGRFEERDGRMSKENYGQDLDEEEVEGDGDDDEDGDEGEDDDEQDDDIYPPDFGKLFPNPDARPVGPEGGNQRPHHQSQYGGNHPTSPQQGRPGHGPASLQGPAALRGPIQAQHGQRQGGIGHGGPSPGGPPPTYRRGPPPTGPSGPPRRYREEGVDEDDVIPEGRQLMSTYGPRRVVSYPNRRVSVYPPRRLVTYPVYQSPRLNFGGYNYNYYKPKPMSMSYRPRVYSPRRIQRYRTELESSVEESPIVIPRSEGARIYNPWSQNPLRPDSYNPRFIVNPTEMLSRRRFRYHPSQIPPSQRIPLYSGTWGNPRNSYVHAQTGDHYGGPYWASQF